MAVLREKLSFGIVLYNEKLEDSITFKSLVKSISMMSDKNNSKTSVYVFDNTPNKKDQLTNSYVEYDSHTEVLYFSENQNRGLPYAYNFFADEASENGKEWLVLLDQDTDLPVDFFEKYISINPAIPIHCPLVFSNKSLMSPSYYRNYRASSMEIPQTDFIPLKDATCINSGLMVNINYFKQVGGYDSALFLDFCDHDFIGRVKKNGGDRLGIIPVELSQQFSAQTHTKRQALARYRLFLQDLKQYYKNKNVLKILFLVDLPRILRLIIKYRTIQPLIIRIYK